jgi:WD40 repeat protein
VIKWELEKKTEEYNSSDKDEKNDKKAKTKRTVLVAYPSKKKEVHKVPSTRLTISEDGEYLAVGGSDGSVAVMKSENLKIVRKRVYFQ